MNLHITKSKNAESFYIAKSYTKANGKTSSVIVRKLGTLNQLIVEHGPTRDDVLAWAKNEVKLETEKYKKDQQTKAVQITFHSDHKLDYGQQVLYRGGYLFPQTFYYRLKLDKICRKLRDKYKFKYDINAILSDLIYARILEPASKRSSYKTASEFLEKRADREVIGQYLQYWKIAKDFANYLELFEKYKTDYQIEAVLEGRFEKFAIDKLKIASFDEKLSVVGLLIGHLGKEFYTYYENDLFVTELFERLKKLKQELENDSEETAGTILENRITKEQERFEKKEAAKQLTVPQRNALVRMLSFLRSAHNVVKEKEEKGTPKGEIFEVLAGLFKKETEKREEQIEQTSQKLQYAFDFLELVFGEGQELVLFVTELNTNPYSVSFISENGCDSYYKYNKKLLFEEEQGEILKELNQIEEEM